MSSGVDRSILFVLLGAAGGLARRLVVPALFELHRGGALPEHFRILAVDRGDMDARALAERLREGHARFGRSGAQAEAQWQGFAQDLAYHRIDIAEPDAYRALHALLEEMEQPLPGPVQSRPA
jgi:glucose-6-phosphate 1-dehydrogenase